MGIQTKLYVSSQTYCTTRASMLAESHRTRASAHAESYRPKLETGTCIKEVIAKYDAK